MNTEFENLGPGDEISIELKGYPARMVVARVYPDWYAFEPKDDAEVRETRRRVLCLDYVNLACYRERGQLRVYKK